MNCMLGVPLFQSGISCDGVGVTYQLDVKEHKGTRYMDTPGLSDIRLRKAAAKAIEQALVMGGDFQIIFVLVWDNGRMREDDLLTMKLVLEAANQIPKNGYAIMFNQCNKRVIQKLDKPTFLSNLNENLANRGAPTTDFVHFAPKIKELDGEDDVVVDLSQETLSFLQNAPHLVIDGEKVTAVNAESFDELKEALAAEQEQKKLAEEAKAQAELREKEAREQHEKEMAARKEAEAARQEADKQAALQVKLRKEAERETSNALEKQRLVEEQAKAARAQADADVRAAREEANWQKAEQQRIQKEREAREERQRELEAENKRLAALAEENKAKSKTSTTSAESDRARRAEAEQRRRTEQAAAEQRKRADQLQRQLDAANNAAAQRDKIRYYYWRQYGNNPTCLYKCSEDDYKSNKGSYYVSPSSGTVNTQYWYGGRYISHCFKHPTLVYCGDTYWYGYFKTNTDKISDGGIFHAYDPMDLIVW